MWSLRNNEKELKPLVFSNGKTQEDIVKEVLEAIKQGHKIIFIRGVCGSGKSAIALNLARNIGKTSIVVPIKSLQEQYINDYTKKLHILDKAKKRKLKISPIVGRQNFKCRFLEENQILHQTALKEKNMNLFDIFQPGSKQLTDQKKDTSCDNNYLPCKIEIKEKNITYLKGYIKQNPTIKADDFSSINDVKRMSIAPACPYWSPVIPSDIEISRFRDSIKTTYKGLQGRDFTIYQRMPGCLYYEQYLLYAVSDVIIFNSMKYRLETLLNRKPMTEVEIIDECDEFLDSFTNQEQINLTRLLYSLNFVFTDKKQNQKLISELTDITNAIKRKFAPSNEIFPIKNTLIEHLLQTFLKNSEFLDEIEIDESNYLFHLDEVARIFMDFLNETYFSVEKRENDLIIHLVTTNLEKRFKELIEKNKVFVMMSGTIHSEGVLRSIFGLSNFKIIDAETQLQGELIPCKHGYEIDCKYSNLNSDKVPRKLYLKTFSKTVACAKPPVLVHLTSFSDLPTEQEKQAFNITNLPSQTELSNQQFQDPFGRRVEDFKNRKFPVLFTTKCTRGIDFPGNTCNSIVISRFPYPNISSLFWKILKRTNPENFMPFYMDKARRELLQRVYRGLRSKTDRVYLLSPDIRVLDFEIR